MTTKTKTRSLDSYPSRKRHVTDTYQPKDDRVQSVSLHRFAKGYFVADITLKDGTELTTSGIYTFRISHMTIRNWHATLDMEIADILEDWKAE